MDDRDSVGHHVDAAGVIRTGLRGRYLLSRALLNKGTAFDEEERHLLGLLGLMPPYFETLEEQAARAYGAFCLCETDIERHINLRALQDINETLFYRLLADHLEEMMPVVYTPVVGMACERFSEIYRRPRGLFLPWSRRGEMDAMLENFGDRDVRVIVVTDGERILGLGDQGVGGMGIPIGKLSLYTVCGGIDPATALPIFLDAGTNNAERLKDPRYLGWHHERITGTDYDEFVESFVDAVDRRWPGVLLQFEDFSQAHAGPLLTRYRDRLCTFNDDIQGTAAVVLGTVLSSCRLTGRPLKDLTVVFLGAGAAGCGIADQIRRALEEEGLEKAEARRRILMVDREGLLVEGMAGLKDFQKPFAQEASRVAAWESGGKIGLTDAVRHGKPGVLIGVSGQAGIFTREVIEAMCGNVERPMILPLSNPTSRSEAAPADILEWSKGRAIVATGSPYDPVTVDGRAVVISQCNNSYIFPGLGLGVLASGCRRISDGMFMAASRALAGEADRLGGESVLPPLGRLREVSVKIAEAVASQGQAEGHAEDVGAEETRKRIAATFWTPHYRPIRPL